MIKVKLNKQMQNAMRMHKMSNTYSLSQCYNSYSYAKEKAYNYCKELYNTCNGYDFKIIGYNCMSFSVGFYCDFEDKTHFVYITKSYDRMCVVD